MINGNTNKKSLANLDETNGLPLDYSSFFSEYRPLMLATAERLGIPLQDREDAVQEVQIKFWTKHGLNMFDPSRNTVFATFLRRWAGLFLLQERDKTNRNARYISTDPIHWALEAADGAVDESNQVVFESDFLSDDFVDSWVETAQTALREAGRESLVPVLNLCVNASQDGKGLSKAKIAKVLNVSPYKADIMVRQLQDTLTEVGMGIDSLREPE